MVLVGLVRAPHGVRGHVKVKMFVEDHSLLSAYGPLTDGETHFDVVAVSVLGTTDVAIVKFGGVDSREASELLRNKHLYIAKSSLPEPAEDEFYESELIGAVAKLEDGAVYGTITGIFNFGTCNIVELATSSGKVVMLPFVESVFPVVDVGAGTVAVVPPEVIGANG
ncbi:MAG: ribosome maturation factor RimM [Anaplasma sp.]